MFEAFPGYTESPGLAMQLPFSNWGSPYAFDWNGDGIPDLYHHNHQGTKRIVERWSDPAVTSQKAGCFSDWDAVIRNATDGTYYAANNGEGFLERNDTIDEEESLNCFHMHSVAFLDIDGDGFNDLYCVTAGGLGMGNSSMLDNAIFWGQADETSELGYRLVGGREAARDARLHGRSLRYGNERGRAQYWFDANGDGLLDLVTLNTERNDETPSPGRFYRNAGNRQFERKGVFGRRFAEYASKAILTDLDGDGFAKELVVPSNCRLTSEHFNCKWRPRNSIGVYRYNETTGGLHRQSLNTMRLPGLRDEPVRPADIQKVSHGIDTQDFDLDGIPDVAILWTTRIDFFLSAPRQNWCNRLIDDSEKERCLLRMGNPRETLDIMPQCGRRGATSIRFADFNLDGRIDMLVVCRNPGLHAIYELQESSRLWRMLESTDGSNVTDYGDLNSLELLLGPPGICDGVPTVTSEELNEGGCKQWLSAEECQALPYNALFTACTLQQLKQVETFPPAIVDLDNDGYVDVMMGHDYGSVVILRNTLGDGGNPNRFLAVNVHAQAGPAVAIGAIVKLEASGMGGFQNETITQLRVVSTLSHASDSQGGTEDRLIFGLGPVGEPIQLRVQWPHCCEPTIIDGIDLAPWVNSMDAPYLVPAPPSDCDRSCFAVQ